MMTNEAATSCLTLAELSKHAIFSFDIKLNEFIYVNPSFKEHVQLKDNSISNSDLNLLIHPEDADYVKQSFKDLLQMESMQTVEFRLLLPDKTIKTVRIEAFHTFTTDKRQVITGIIEDITAFKEHSDTLNKFSNKKNSILNILSRDLLSPLGTIQSLSEIINRKITTSEHQELNRLVSSIGKISRHSIALIRNLLTQEFLEVQVPNWCCEEQTL